MLEEASLGRMKASKFALKNGKIKTGSSSTHSSSSPILEVECFKIVAQQFTDTCSGLSVISPLYWLEH